MITHDSLSPFLFPLEEFQSLLSLTQLYLKQEHSQNDWVSTDPETYSFFKVYATAKKAHAPPPTLQKDNPQQMRLTSPLPTPPPSIKPPLSPIPSPTPALNSNPKIASLNIATASSTPFKETSAPKVLKETPNPTQDLQKASPPPLAPPPSPPPVDDFADLRKILQTKFPNQIILDAIPEPGSLSLLSPISQATPQAFILTTDDETEEDLFFLRKIAEAITSHFCPTSVIPHNTFQHDSLPRLILGSETTLNTLSFDTDFPPPLIPLKSTSLYASQPALKADLWKQIKNAF